MHAQLGDPMRLFITPDSKSTQMDRTDTRGKTKTQLVQNDVKLGTMFGTHDPKLGRATFLRRSRDEPNRNDDEGGAGEYQRAAAQCVRSQSWSDADGSTETIAEHREREARKVWRRHRDCLYARQSAPHASAQGWGQSLRRRLEAWEMRFLRQIPGIHRMPDESWVTFDRRRKARTGTAAGCRRRSGDWNVRAMQAWLGHIGSSSPVVVHWSGGMRGGGGARSRRVAWGQESWRHPARKWDRLHGFSSAESYGVDWRWKALQHVQRHAAFPSWSS